MLLFQFEISFLSSLKMGSYKKPKFLKLKKSNSKESQTTSSISVCETKIKVVRFFFFFLLGLMSLNPIVWCYVCYYVWLNVVINKVSLLLSKILIAWIFEHYHIVYEMHSMWFSHRRYRSQVLCKLIILVRSRWWNWAFHLRRL